MDQFLHEFRSITEEQWQSGLSRLKCAICRQDYGDPIHCVATTPSLESNWPLVVVIEDCFVPRSADEIIKLTQSTSTDQYYAMIIALAVYAEFQIRGARLN